MSRRSLIVIIAVGLVGLAVAGVGIHRAASSGQAVTSEHPVAIPRDLRTVAVSQTMPAPSLTARHLSAMLEAGTMPTQKTMAEVVSDTQCSPDAEMISRCRNEVRLAGGSTLVLRHPHDMRHVPCLAPGEQVLIVPSAA